MQPGMRELTMDEVNFISGGASATKALTARQDQQLYQNVVTAAEASGAAAAASGTQKAIATVVTADLTEWGFSAAVASGLGAAAGVLATSAIAGVAVDAYYGVQTIFNMISDSLENGTLNPQSVVSSEAVQVAVLDETDEETSDPWGNS